MTDKPTNPLIIYHAPSCWDGHCAAWLASKAFPDAEFVKAQHGSKPPANVEDRAVFILDFSYPREVMTGLIRQIGPGGSLVILDHHISAQKDLTGLQAVYEAEGVVGSVVFDMNKSGGYLTWEYLYSRAFLPEDWMRAFALDRAPWLVNFTQDRDLWKFELPHSKEVNATLRSHRLRFDVWDTLHSIQTLEGVIAEGEAILRCEQQLVDNHTYHARPTTIAGHKVMAVNATCLFSEIGAALAVGKPFSACYFIRDDGRYQFSLRSAPGGIDVSEVAKRFGGGGHAAASGCSVAALSEILGT